jgi:coniferyl-aldehyde dehydrogenase
MTHPLTVDSNEAPPITNEKNTSSNMQDILQRQQQSFLNEGFVSAEKRIDRLQRLLRLIGENQQALIEVCNNDFGNRSKHQTKMADIMSTMSSIQHTIKHVKKWMQTDKRKVMVPLNLFGAKARVEYQPKGVIGNISTWNFPIHVALAPLAGIFAAGNRAMVKLSEITPETSDLLQRLIAQYFDETECVGINGGPEVGAEFAALPFDHIIFTGATGIGRHILHAAADNLTPVTLELGGKSPVIVSNSYDIKKSAERIMTGKALNMGQVCLSPDYCFVPAEKLESFISEFSAYCSTLFPTILDNPDYTSVVSARHYQRLNNIIQDAKDKGGDVRIINPANEDFSSQPDGLHRIPMTLVINPTDDMLVMQEEIFGPIFGIKSYEKVQEAVHYINAHPRPLGLYYFGEDSTEERYVLDHTISGGVAINDVIVQVSCEDLPFGGIGQSGMGNYHGHEGFLTFSHAKSIFRQSKIDLTKLAGMVPPYGEKCDKQLDKMTTIK